MKTRSLAMVALAAIVLASPAAARWKVPSVRVLAELAPKANAEYLELALSAMSCAQAKGVGTKARRLTFIDYSLPSLEKRLWVFDLGGEPSLLYEEHVAHGKNTGENMARRFSNTEGTLQSSLGLFLTGETYEGKNGYSLKLDGLEPVNDQARARTIVMHGAPYVDPVVGRKQGRLGRSWGCPAVRPAIATELLDAIRGGTFVFAWYPDDTWTSCSPFLRCEEPPPRPRRR